MHVRPVLRFWSRQEGFTLVEIVISLSIVLMVVAPLFYVFSGSRRAVQAARELSVAASLVSSLVAGLKNARPGTLQDLGLTRDIALPAGLDLVSLGVSAPPQGFSRHLSLRRLAGRGTPREPLYRADLRVDWVSPRHGHTQSYAAVGVVQGRSPP